MYVHSTYTTIDRQESGELNESERENYRYIDIIDIFGIYEL